MDVVRSLADRIVVLHKGKLVADGEPAEVIDSDIVQEAYLGGRRCVSLEGRATPSRASASMSDRSSAPS